MTTLQSALRWHRPLMVFAAVMAVLAIVSVAGLRLDDRVLVGAPIWLKPLKFSISFVAYSVTLAWMLTFVSRGRRLANVAATVIAVTGAVEMVPIVVQVIRGRRSHFNVATDLDDRLWTAMGITIAVLWSATLLVAIVLFRTAVADRASRWAIRLGIVLSLAGMGVGGFMLRPTPAQEQLIAADMETVVGAHSVGVNEGGPGMFLTGWSTTGGDLRIGHFVGLHALQALPLLAMLLGALARSRRLPAGWLGPTRRLRLVLVVATVYAGAIALVTWQALRGQPLPRPDAATATATGLLLALAAVGGFLAVKLPVADQAEPADLAVRPEPQKVS